MASPQQITFLIAVNEKKWVRAYIQEKQLGYINEGMEVSVYIDSYSDKPIKGQIGYISSVAEFTPKTVQTAELRTSLLYEIRVYVKDSEDILRMGMPATIKINSYNTADSKEIADRKKALETYLAVQINYSIDRVSWTLDASTFGDWLYYDAGKWKFKKKLPELCSKLILWFNRRII